MKYLKMRKTEPGKWFEVDRETAWRTLGTSYKLEAVDELLNTPNEYKCMFSFIKVEED